MKLYFAVVVLLILRFDFSLSIKDELGTISDLPNLIPLSDSNHVQMGSLMWPHGSLAEALQSDYDN